MAEFRIEPNNLLRQDASDAAIQGAIDVAYGNGLSHVQRLSDNAFGVRGKSILELGPGPNFAPALIMIAFGAKFPVTVVDPWIAPFDEDYHPAIYRGVAERLKREHAEADVEPLLLCAEKKKHIKKYLNLVESPAESLNGLVKENFDSIVSNAVLEHVPDMGRASREMFRLSKPGSISIHAVDMRDHSQFHRPLDYLLQNKKEEDSWHRKTEYHIGSLRRKADYDGYFKAAGFEIVTDWVTSRVDEDYFNQFLPKLRAYEGATYRNHPEEDLRVTGILYVLKRPE